MAKRARVKRPPTTNNPNLDAWNRQVADALNQFIITGPLIASIETTFNVNGEAVVSASVADEEEGSAIYTTVGDGTDPADPTAATNDGKIAGGSGTVDTGVKITTGNDAFVKAVAENPRGLLGSIRSARFARRVEPFHTDATSRTHSGDTTETTIETITVPANKLGANGGLRLTLSLHYIGGGGNKRVDVDFGGVRLFTDTRLANFGGGRSVITLLLFNDGATDSQIYTHIVLPNGRDTEIGSSTAAVDTTSDQDLDIRVKLDNSADIVELELSIAEFLGTE